jgi:hypothetical protein
LPTKLAFVAAELVGILGRIFQGAWVRCYDRGGSSKRHYRPLISRALQQSAYFQEFDGSTTFVVTERASQI